MLGEHAQAAAGRVLLVEHDAADARLVVSALSEVSPFDFEIEFATSVEDAESILATREVDLVLLDLTTLKGPWAAALDRITRAGPHSTIVLAPVNDEAAALAAVSHGADDYVLKGSLRKSELGRSIRYAMDRQRLLAASATREERLQAAIEAQKMWVVGRLAASVAHEFNNLLTGLMGDAELLRSSLGPQEPFQTYASSIASGLERAALLTRQLVSFSRKQMLAPKVLDLSRLVSRLEPVLQSVVGADVTLQLRVDADAPLIKADPAQVEQMILNLAHNAKDAVGEAGSITLRVAGMTREHDRYALVVVEDDGDGMEAHTVSRIFEPFFTTRGRTGRVGLGLSTVSHIVERSHGHVDVRSAPGEGTEFRILLPAVEGSAEPHSAEMDAVLADIIPTERILVVDDEDGVRRLLERVLSDAGYEVIAAADGVEALAAARRAPELDLLVTDVVMPHLNGRDLAAELRTMHPNLKVLFISGYDEEILSPDGTLEDGMNFLGKPFHLRDVLRMVRRTLG